MDFKGDIKDLKNPGELDRAVDESVAEERTKQMEQNFTAALMEIHNIHKFRGFVLRKCHPKCLKAF